MISFAFSIGDLSLHLRVIYRRFYNGHRFFRQCNFKGKEVSPSKLSRLIRQHAAIDESMPPTGRRGSQPTLSPDPDEGGRYQLLLQLIYFSTYTIYKNKIPCIILRNSSYPSVSQ